MLQAKPIEESAAAVSDGSSPVCAWAKAQTSVTARLELQAPLYPPWQPPPLPAVALQQLIPKREFVKKEERPTASQAFQSQVQAAAKQLAVDYHKVAVHQHPLLASLMFGSTVVGIACLSQRITSTSFLNGSATSKRPEMWRQ